MISCALLERPGKWRVVGLGLGLLIAFAPPLFLVGEVGGTISSGTDLLGAGFGRALARSAVVAATVMVLSLTIGAPLGLIAGLYNFRFRPALLGLLLLPLLLPSFLWAIGFSMLLGHSITGPGAAFIATALTFSSLALPLVIFMAMIATRGISGSQADAARLAGGERTLLAYAARSAFPATAMSALLASVLTFADPGPGQILGFGGVGAEILTSFAAHFDVALATRQCLAVGGLVLVVIGPLVVVTAARLAAGLLGRDVHSLQRRPGAHWPGPAALLAVFIATAFLPLLGLVRPVTREFRWEFVAREFSRTLPNTLFIALVSGALATLAGFVLALCAGRDAKLRAWLLGTVIVLLALPPALSALGWITAGTAAPAFFDPLFRGRWAAAIHLAIRGFPFATIIALRTLGTTSPSWSEAAALHGVPLWRFLRRVLLPILFPSALLALLLVALLSLADVGSLLLLAPPGQTSLPLAIFTVMANAPESLVGSLCLAYVAAVALILASGSAFILCRKST